MGCLQKMKWIWLLKSFNHGIMHFRKRRFALVTMMPGSTDRHLMPEYLQNGLKIIQMLLKPLDGYGMIILTILMFDTPMVMDQEVRLMELSKEYYTGIYL